jgi:hypothetical protein
MIAGRSKSRVLGICRASTTEPSGRIGGRTSGSCPLARVSCSSRGVAFFRSPSLAAVTAELCCGDTTTLSHEQSCRTCAVQDCSLPYED